LRCMISIWSAPGFPNRCCWRGRRWRGVTRTTCSPPTICCGPGGCARRSTSTPRSVRRDSLQTDPASEIVVLYQALIAPFVDFEFMRRALAGTLALALAAGPLGVFLLLRRMSLVGDAMAHAILPGAAIGFLVSGLNLFAMTAGGLIAGLMVA